MRWSNCTVSVFSKKLRHSGTRRTAATRRARRRRRSAAKCCRCNRRADRRPAHRDRSAPAPGRAAEAQARMRAGTGAGGRSSSRCAVQSMRDVDHAGEHEMRRQPVLRDLDAIGEARRHHPPADRALQRAERRKSTTAAPRNPGAIQPRHRNHRNGSRKADADQRPSRRCVHSHQ